MEFQAGCIEQNHFGYNGMWTDQIEYLWRKHEKCQKLTYIWSHLISVESYVVLTKKNIYQLLFEINYHKSESTLMPFRSIVNSVTSLLVCKFEPFWLGVSVESLILRWPLRPVGLWSLSSFHSCSGISITFLLELKVQMGIFKPPRSKICGGGVGGILFLSCHFVILSESKLHVELWYFTWVFLVTRPFFGFLLFSVT